MATEPDFTESKAAREARRKAEMSRHPCVATPSEVLLVPLREGITSPRAAGKPHLKVVQE